MPPLQTLLNTYRHAAVTEREKGTYFEELIACYLRNEATYHDLYSDVWTYADWAGQQGLDKRDTGIDLVARTRGTNKYHAIQCKLALLAPEVVEWLISDPDVVLEQVMRRAWPEDLGDQVRIVTPAVVLTDVSAHFVPRLGTVYNTHHKQHHRHFNQHPYNRC